MPIPSKQHKEQPKGIRVRVEFVCPATDLNTGEKVAKVLDSKTFFAGFDHPIALLDPKLQSYLFKQFQLAIGTMLSSYGRNKPIIFTAQGGIANG